MNLFRKKYQQECCEKFGDQYDSNFIGTHFKKKDKRINGFFEMTHGHKPNIASYLPTILKIAEDEQAIYEFLQNAADCGSSEFYIEYNSDYLLAINNGSAFTPEEMQSIINIAYTTKIDDCSKIGRFGIGFKLVHRLVGRDDGVDELTMQYSGPMLFSWTSQIQLEEFLSFNTAKSLNIAKDDSESALPWLLKLILTNFPCHPGELVRDLRYEEQILFSMEEMYECISFASDFFEKHPELLINGALKNGTLYFIRLGKGKEKLLDKNKDDIISGVQFSLNFLNKLQKVYVNGSIIEKTHLNFIPINIPSKSEEFRQINPANKSCDISTSIGYPNYFSEVNLKNHPSIFKFFPMGDEMNNFSFLIHSDGFDNESNRRKLHESEINKQLLSVVAERLINVLIEFKNENRAEYINLYASILNSDIPNKSNNKWLYDPFFVKLLDYIRQTVPTVNNLDQETENVKIKNFDFEITPAEFGLEEIHWFYYSNNKSLCKEAELQEKLNLDKWSIKSLFQNGKIEKIEEWIKIDDDKSKTFLKQLLDDENIKSIADKLITTRLFKFSDGNYYSIEEVQKSNHLLFLSPKIKAIKEILEAMGIGVSEDDVSEFKAYSLLSKNIRKEEETYELISQNTHKNTLTSQQKHRLFKSLIHPETKLNGVAEGTLKKLVLFSNEAGQLKPLKELIPRTKAIPDWLYQYRVTESDHDDSLQNYFIKEEEVFPIIIHTNWKQIIGEIKKASSFYSEVIMLYQKSKTDLVFSVNTPIVITRNGIKSINEVFYNQQLSKVKDYSGLEDYIESVFGLFLPQREVLPFLGERPFKIDPIDFGIISVLENTSINLSGLSAFIDLIRLNKLPFCKLFIVSQKSGQLSVHRRNSGIYQYRSDERIKNFISSIEQLDNNLIAIPEIITELSTEDGLLDEVSFIQHLVRKILNQEDILRLAELLEDVHLVEEILKSIEIVCFDNSIDYTTDSFEFKALKLAVEISHLPGALNNFRSKINFQDGENSFLLSEVPARNSNIEFSNGKYSLPISKIFSEEKIMNNAINRIIKKFCSLGINKIKLEIVFGVEEQNHQEILRNIPEILENGYQLAFIILYNIYIEELDLNKYFVETKDAEASYSLTSNFYFTDYVFIKHHSILDSRYHDFPDELKKSDLLLNGNLNLSECPLFSLEPFYEIDLKEDLTDAEKIELLNQLFVYWDSKDANLQLIKEKHSSILKVELANLVNSKKNVLSIEKIPTFLTAFISNDPGRLFFLESLGLMQRESEVVKLREFFRNKNPIDEFPLTSDLSQFFLINTIEWLETEKITLSTIHHHATLKRIVEQISDNNVQIIETIEDLSIESSEEMVGELYERWKAGIAFPIRIFIHPGPISKSLFISTKEWNFGNVLAPDYFITEGNDIYINCDSDLNVILVQIANQYEDLMKPLLTFMAMVAINGGKTPETEKIKSDIASKSESILYDYLKEHFPEFQVVWLNDDGKGRYAENFHSWDFEIRNKSGEVEFYVECKGTLKKKNTFYLTKKEWEWFALNSNKYQIFRLYDLETTPQITCIPNLLEWLIEGKAFPFLSVGEWVEKERVVITLSENSF